MEFRSIDSPLLNSPYDEGLILKGDDGSDAVGCDELASSHGPFDHGHVFSLQEQMGREVDISKRPKGRDGVIGVGRHCVRVREEYSVLQMRIGIDERG